MKFSSKQIAPCGMNCNLCVAFLRDEKKCPGCRFREKHCAIHNCKIFKKNKFRYCFECDNFPCVRIKHLDKRYKTRYGMSMIENLENIKNKGIKEFIKEQKKKWTKAGKIICVHNKKLY